MANDIIEAWNEFDEAGEFHGLSYKVHFDPRQFAEEHPAPTLEEFELDYAELLEWGRTCAQL